MPTKMKRLSLSVFSFSALFATILLVAAAFFSPAESAYAVDTSTLSIRTEGRTPDAEIAEKGGKHTIGYIILKAEGGLIQIDKIIMRPASGSNSTAIRKVALIDDRGITVAGPEAIENEVIIFQDDIFLDMGEEKRLAVVAEMSSTAVVGDVVNFEISKKTNITANGERGSDAVISGDFPIIFEPMVVVNEDTNVLLSLEIADEGEGSLSIQAGEKDVATETVHFRALGETGAQIISLTWNKSGNIPSNEIKNIRLIDESGNILAGPEVLTGNAIVFDTPFVIPQGDTVDAKIVFDVGTDAENGDDFGLELYSLTSIEAKAEDSASVITIVNNFPLRIAKRTIALPSAHIVFHPETTKAQPIHGGDSGFTMAKFIVTSGLEPITISQMKITPFGEYGVTPLRNLRIEDEEGTVLIDSVTGGNAPQKITLGADDEQILVIKADILNSAKGGETVGLQLSDAESFIVTGEDGQTITIGGPFPLKTPLMTVSEIVGEGYVNADILPVSPSLTEIYAGMPNVPIARIRFHAEKKDVEVQDFTLTLGGTIDGGIFTGWRLIDEYGNTMAGPEDVEHGQVVFSDPIGIGEGEDREFLIIAEMEDVSVTGKTISLSLEQSGDIRARQIYGLIPAGVVGQFPDRSSALTIRIPDVEKYLQVYAEVFSLGNVPLQEEGVVFGKIHLLSVGTDGEVIRILLKRTGSMKDKLEAIRFMSGDLKIDSQNNPEADVISIDEPFEILGGEETIISFEADIGAEAMAGESFGLEITSSAYISVNSVKGGEMPVYGNFPLSVGKFKMAGGEKLFCSAEYEPVCGRKYDTCVEYPCDPQAVDYDNLCKMREGKAFLIFDGKCEDMPELQVIEEEEEEEDKPASIPSASFEDSVLEDVSLYQNPFPDTDLDTLEGKAAMELYRRDVIGGFPDGEFKGLQKVNRAQAAKFLLLARYGEVEDTIEGSGLFSDVIITEWYAKYVLTAAKKGIINGYGDGTFKPGNMVNTAEFLKMMTLTFGLPVNLEHSFRDVNVGDWFSMYAGTASEYDLFPERTELLRPEAMLARDEVAVAVYQYLKNRE